MKDPIEEALEKMRPAEMPPALMARLTAARPQSRAARGGLWRRWIIPLVAGATAAVMALLLLRTAPPPEEKRAVAAVAPVPFERQDYLVGTREIGVLVAPDQRPYRVLEIEWLEQDTIGAPEDGPAIRVQTTRREVVPVALEIF